MIGLNHTEDNKYYKVHKFVNDVNLLKVTAKRSVK